MSLLHRARFYTTAASTEQLSNPELATGLPEVAFVGRSNAGKSTAINLICNQRQLAFASKTPGRTQNLNYFVVEDRDRSYGYLVDLPGYGYAQTSHTLRTHWSGFLGGYLRDRETLKGIVLMMDARRPLMDSDQQLLEFLAPTGRPVHALLTKADKLSRSDLAQTLASVRKSFEGTDHTVQTFSSLKRMGLESADDRISQWLGIEKAPPAAKKTPASKLAGA
ncbi:ribosome biogenesis GTP-binding protein YihA/YsxC [soil metagenome]